MRAGVALGSNLGEPLQHLRAARAAIAKIPGVSGPVLSSGIYETEPVDCEEGAPSFMNAVVEFDYQGDAELLLSELRGIEYAMGRPRDRARNISRPIDLDLLYFGDLTLQTEGLRLPHPRMTERRFVLQPLADIRPELTLPGQTKSIAELLGSLDHDKAVVRLTSDWD